MSKCSQEPESKQGGYDKWIIMTDDSVLGRESRKLIEKTQELENHDLCLDLKQSAQGATSDRITLISIGAFNQRVLWSSHNEDEQLPHVMLVDGDPDNDDFNLLKRSGIDVITHEQLPSLLTGDLFYSPQEVVTQLAM